MAKWGKADFRQLKQLQERIDKLERIDLDKFCVDVSKELAARLLALVIHRTPIGVYPEGTGKNGGTLKRGWTASKNTGAQAYANSMPVTKTGHTYTIQVINPVEYASYVEFGHRTRGGKGWVNGHYFLTISEEDLQQMAPSVIQRKLDKLLKEAFDG